MYEFKFWGTKGKQFSDIVFEKNPSYLFFSCFYSIVEVFKLNNINNGDLLVYRKTWHEK